MPRKHHELIEEIPSEKSDSEQSLRGYEILSYPADFTLEVLAGKWKKGEIVVPSLQRRFIWNQVRASKLIESFLMGLPVPPVFFYLETGTDKLLVVDGHQRLRSIVDFFSGKFGDKNALGERVDFTLIGLDQNSPYLDATYESLQKKKNEAAFNRLNNSVLRSFVVKQVNPKDDTSIFQIFERLNTGGVILQGQEIRNCIYEGPFNEMLCGRRKKNSLNKYKQWRKVFGTASEDKRQRDAELILRFLALFYNIELYKKPMKKFLNDFMRENRRAASDKLFEYEYLFRKTCDAVIEYLGEKPFHIHAGLNAAVYDSVFNAFASNLDKLSTKYETKRSRGQLKVKYEQLIKNKTYLKLVSAATTDEEVIPKRIRIAKRILFK
jgi:uncharacterized protein with ParB-like and HNH nuclease domain